MPLAASHSLARFVACQTLEFRTHRATGVRVSKVLPCEDDYIVLLDHYHASQARLRANVRRLRSDGVVVWAVSTPGSSDIFTDVECATIV